MKITTNRDLTTLVIEQVYIPCGLVVSNHVLDREGIAYDASSFQLKGLKVIARKAKITPKKSGQFVTLWKRNANGETAPYHETDTVDLFVINIMQGSRMGQFVFPSNVLIEKGIVSYAQKPGKRGFRVYPPWSIPSNKTAQISQKWQLEYFLEIGQNINIDHSKARSLYLLD